ncbi:uncharacterized protein LOC131651879 [Vicia villosa]|uniref:uncharacterized protein LOC131651879 n=1 Tax=Vicia villosa TaxID=3911 RepID=UPI00273ADDA8|nr:uncharacterized protein LOC131651879 [Vicia villosa]
MASQLVSDVRCQPLLMQYAASYGERGSKQKPFRRQNYGYRRIENSIINPEESATFKEHKNKKESSSYEKGAKRSTNLAQAQKLQRLGFSYLATSFLYMVIKVKAFYTGFIGDVGNESRMVGIEAPVAEAYFSVPVLPN